jgi:hypothetical protein
MLRSTLLLCLALSTSALAKDKDPKVEGGPSGWSVAKATMKSGAVVVMSYRPAEPPKVNRAVYQWRAVVSCRYLDRGDASGMPAVDVLHTLQQLEATLESPATALRLWSKTGETKREALFQVKDKVAFGAALQAVATKLVLECTVEVAQDPRWSLWAETVKALAEKEKPTTP